MHRVTLLLLPLLACSGGKPSDSASPVTGPSSGTVAGLPTGTPAGTTAVSGCYGVTSGPSVLTSLGCLVGREADGVEGFLGVRYAKPPVGDLRWARPEVEGRSPEPVDATEIGSPCIQTNGTVDLELNAGDGAEDCLFLNVLRPEGTEPGDDKPILVFVHGGSHLDGHGGSAGHLGSSFNRPPSDPPLAADAAQIVSEQDAIVVTMNYRLGQLGWMSHPGLTAESGDGASGNQGLWDALLALQWVNDNALALGGDPGRILLHGESAGSVNVCSLLTSPEAFGLFSAAILQSGTCSHVVRGLDSAPLFVEPAHDQGHRLAEALGCDTAGDDAAVLACMRGKTDAEVMAVMRGSLGNLDGSSESWQPVVDGVLLPGPPGDRIAAGQIASVPVVLGTTADEGTLFTTFAPMPNEAAFDTLLAGVALVFGWDVTGLQDLYDPATRYGGDLQAAYAAAYGDIGFVCPTRQTADQLAAHTDVRAYWWTHENPITAFLGAHHGVEITYTFGTGLDLGEQRTMNDIGTSAWASVARGTPEVTDVGPWPLYGNSAPDGGIWVELSTTPSVLAEGPRKAECDWMDAQ